MDYKRPTFRLLSFLATALFTYFSFFAPFVSFVPFVPLVVEAAQAPQSVVADAAMQKNTAAIRDLLKRRRRRQCRARRRDDRAALGRVAGDLELAQMLLVAGANVRAATRINGYTPLFLASREGHGAVVGALLEAGADAKAVSMTGSTPLMLAAAAGNVDAVQRLLDAGADIQRERKGARPDRHHVRGGVQSRRRHQPAGAPRGRLEGDEQSGRSLRPDPRGSAASGRERRRRWPSGTRCGGRARTCAGARASTAPTTTPS